MKISTRASTAAIGGLLLLACAMGPWVAACGSDLPAAVDTTDAGTPTPTTTTTGTAPPPPTASCTDGSRNGTETDVDCGGSCSTKCAAGKGCTAPADCATGACKANVCAAPSCIDAVKNGTETDVDCGSSCPNKCGVGSGCANGADCTTGVCDPSSKKCSTAGCMDTVKNGNETDVDCGGSCPNACADTKGCALASDCSSGVCNAGTHTCSAPVCTDVVKNGTETDVDCGGECPNKCADTKKCALAADCTSGVCNAGTHTCSAPLCTDVVKNGSETDVDCGGSCATKCAAAKKCLVAGDCASGVCDPGTHVCSTAACVDTVKNGDETDVDCGGSCPNKCADTKACAIAGDCTSGVCTGAVCQAPLCNDTVKNGAETDVDCGGGTCPACADALKCVNGTDCTSGVCNGVVCQTAVCTDAVKNGSETDVDCGGSCPTKCADALGCALASDCASGVCTGGVCQAPLCNDVVKNGAETDVDCGGGTCSACADNMSCALASDCTSGVCTGKQCQAPLCTDTVKNGSETDIDCGGSCNKCGDTKKCALGSDCTSGICNAGSCATPLCSDTVKNGTETDVDCGGTCSKCASGKVCGVAADCATGVCTGGICQAALCTDSVKNGAETDVDCGGGTCGGCAIGKVCAGNGDCGSGLCTGGICAVVNGTYSGSGAMPHTFVTATDDAAQYGRIDTTATFSQTATANTITPGIATTLKKLTLSVAAGNTGMRSWTGTVGIVTGGVWAATGLTCTIPVNGTTCNVTTNVAVSATQSINVRMSQNARTATARTADWSVTYTRP